MTAAGVRRRLAAYADPVRARHSRRYFKTGPGDYGEGDRFIGVTVPDQRRVAREFRDLPLAQADRLLRSAIHEERAVALMILVDQFARGASLPPAARAKIVRLYLRRLRYVNNWDLVDISAPGILGGWLSCPDGAPHRRRV